eukprot:scaffold158456_cov39-Prasinocladus_malaysianus.AAC.1
MHSAPPLSEGFGRIRRRGATPNQAHPELLPKRMRRIRKRKRRKTSRLSWQPSDGLRPWAGARSQSSVSLHLK